MKGKVDNLSLDDSEVKCGGVCLGLDVYLGVCSELDYFGIGTVLVDSLEATVVVDAEGVGIDFKLAIGEEPQSFFLCDALPIENGSWRKGEVKIIDQVKQVTGVELEGIALPLLVEDDIEPLILVEVVDY